MSVAEEGCEGSGEQTEGYMALGWFLSMSGENENFLGEGGQWKEMTKPNP